jgi:hypothetical protein
MHDTGSRYIATGRVAIMILVFLTLVGLAERPADANGQLSFEDWLAAQSTRCKDYDGDGTPCEPFTGQPFADQYIPANQSYVFFTAPAQGRVAVVDWLGISWGYLLDVCGVDLGTTTTGTVTAHGVGNGEVLVSVRGHTRNAMAFVADDPSPSPSPFSLPLLFGAREADICTGAAEASLVDVEFKVEYYTDASDPIVDNQYFGNPPSTGGFPDDPFRFRKIMIRVHGEGTLADGSPGRLVMNQTGIFQSRSKSPKFDGFPVEFIELHPVGR